MGVRSCSGEHGGQLLEHGGQVLFRACFDANALRQALTPNATI